MCEIVREHAELLVVFFRRAIRFETAEYSVELRFQQILGLLVDGLILSSGKQGIIHGLEDGIGCSCSSGYGINRICLVIYQLLELDIRHLLRETGISGFIEINPIGTCDLTGLDGDFDLEISGSSGESIDSFSDIDSIFECFLLLIRTADSESGIELVEIRCAIECVRLV